MSEEIRSIKELINGQNWLAEEEKAFLMEQIDPLHPPRPKTLHSWNSLILQSFDPSQKNLPAIGIELAAKQAKEQHRELDKESELAFVETSRKLGFLERNTGFAFQEGHITLTSEHDSATSFDVSALQGILEGNQAALIQKVKSVISAPDFAYVAPDPFNEYRQQVFDWCKILADHGLGSWGFPKEDGGKGDMEGYFTIMETLSYHDLSLVIKFGVQFGLWGMSVYYLGTEKHHRKYLREIGSLSLPGCFAMTETGHGSNVKGIRTTATYNHEDQTFSIHSPDPSSRKEYIGNAAVHGQMATVFAKLVIDGIDYGVNAFVVPLRDESGKLENGVTIEDCGRKMGLNGVDNGVIYFDQVIIPKENMLDKYASVNEAGEFESPISSDNRRFFVMLGTLVGGRIGIPRSALTAAKSGLTIAIRYGDKRRQFGPEGGEEVPILNYRMHQRRLIPPLATSYALHFALKYLTERFLNKAEEEAQEIEALAAGLKAYTTWFATATLQEAREACGGKGYLSENRIDALKNDTEIYTTFEGDNTVLMQLVAKSRLTEFRQEFGDMNVFGIFNFVTDKAMTYVSEKNPLIIRSTNPEHLLDFDFHLNAFRYREQAILGSAASRLKRLIDGGMDSFDAFNVCQHHLINVGQAYIERVVLEQFQEKIKSIADKGSKKALTQMCQLYALHTLEKNRGWFLEQDYMEGVKTKAIRKMVNQLCWEIRPDAIALTDAFAIPESCLSAPIAKRESL
ncbi:acyl-CoA dehydrogenase [Rhodonellum sp.]|uniref:acyl-CoA dehydrogenase family protein n=1 Tax=Rhodonellum sp. TaxID=2231180 RepID=UPI00351DD09A